MITFLRILDRVIFWTFWLGYAALNTKMFVDFFVTGDHVLLALAAIMVVLAQIQWRHFLKKYQ